MNTRSLIKKIDKRDSDSMLRVCAEVDLRCEIITFKNTDVVMAVIHSSYDMTLEFAFTFGERFNSACECDRMNEKVTPDKTTS